MFIRSIFKPRGRGKVRELFSPIEGRKKIHMQRNHLWKAVSSCSHPSLPVTKKEEKSEAAIFSLNSFLKCSEPDAQSFIFMELDHKRDQACSLVICHQIERMWCPNVERMSCPKHLFLAMSFPAWRSKLQLIDKHKSQTPSTLSSPPLIDSTPFSQPGTFIFSMFEPVWGCSDL